ncbi:MAG: ABC transporter substrate-binding protein [Thermoguttaceae bacterium]
MLAADTSPSDAPLVLQLHWYPQAQFAGYMMAEEKGFFRKAGLTVKLRWSDAGEKPFEQLAEGRCQFCTGWLCEAVREWDAGHRLVNVAQVFQRSSTLLVTWNDSSIKRPEDISGKRVGLWGGNNDIQTLTFFRRRKIEPIIVPQSASIVPFLRGAVDVASAMHYNEYHKFIEAGVSPDRLRVFSLADYGLDFPEDGLYCTAATRRDRAATCAALVAACRQGWNYALDHESETLNVVMKHCRATGARTNRNHQQWMLRSVGVAIRGQPGDTTAPFGNLSAKAYGSVAQMLRDQHLLRASPAFEQLYQPVSHGDNPQGR